VIDEWPQTYGRKLRKARKDQKCFECRGIIKKGELYNYHHGIWSEGPQDFKVCQDCDVLRAKLNTDVPHDEQAAFGELYESVFESERLEIMQEFVRIKYLREAEIPAWMTRKIADLQIGKQKTTP